MVKLGGITLRIIKLSQEVPGFDSLDSSLFYFKNVLPWYQFIFYIVGEGHHIAYPGLKKDEVVIFSYIGKIIAIGKAKESLTDGNKVTGLVIDDDTFKVFHNPINLIDLEAELKKIDPGIAINKNRGWNHIDNTLENKALQFLAKKDWESLLN